MRRAVTAGSNTQTMFQLAQIDIVRKAPAMTNEILPDEVIRLWPDGPPLKLEGVGREVEFRGR
jgi:hypothetical protein